MEWIDGMTSVSHSQAEQCPGLLRLRPEGIQAQEPEGIQAKKDKEK